MVLECLRPNRGVGVLSGDTNRSGTIDGEFVEHGLVGAAIGHREIHLYVRSGGAFNAEGKGGDEGGEKDPVKNNNVRQNQTH